MSGPAPSFPSPNETATDDWDLPAWPVYGLQSDIRPALADAVSNRRPSVLATLYSSDGPTPLGEGAQMLFEGGAAAGFLSGGCVEGDVAIHARAVLKDGRPERRVYGRGGPVDLPLLCGSRIEILLERVAPDDAAALTLLASSAARRPALWLTDGRERACVAEDASADQVPATLRPVLAKARDDAGLAGGAAGGVFRRYRPQLRLVVVGRDPIALAICRMASEVGFLVTLVRPLGPQAPPSIPGLAYVHAPLDDAFGSLFLDRWTAVVVATHETDLDHAALKATLPTDAFFVGAIGSRRRLLARRKRLAAEGVPADAVQRLHAPLGLAIGARSPFEIAVSVLAEIILVSKSSDTRRGIPGSVGSHL